MGMWQGVYPKIDPQNVHENLRCALLLLNYYPKGRIWWRFVAPPNQNSSILSPIFLCLNSMYCCSWFFWWIKMMVKRWLYHPIEKCAYQVGPPRKNEDSKYVKVRNHLCKQMNDSEIWALGLEIMWFILCFLPFQKMLRHFPAWRKPSPSRSLQSGGWHHRHRRAARWKGFPRYILVTRQL